MWACDGSHRALGPQRPMGGRGFCGVQAPRRLIGQGGLGQERGAAGTLSVGRGGVAHTSHPPRSKEVCGRTEWPSERSSQGLCLSVLCDRGTEAEWGEVFLGPRERLDLLRTSAGTRPVCPPLVGGGWMQKPLVVSWGDVLRGKQGPFGQMGS